MPLNIDKAFNNKRSHYGSNITSNEANAMAAYIQSGKRIPRRGEVGLTAEEIDRYEKLGYVMSGSRNKKMNAVRLRKECQVYSVEDKRALAILNFEENQRKEQEIVMEMKNILNAKMKDVRQSVAKKEKEQAAMEAIDD